MDIFLEPDLDGWDIKQIKHDNDKFFETVGIRNKNKKNFWITCIRIAVLIPLIIFCIMVVKNKPVEPLVEKTIVEQAVAEAPAVKTSVAKKEVDNAVEKKSAPVQERAPGSTQVKEIPKPVVVLRDYSSCKPWEAFVVIKKENFLSDDKAVVDYLFNYFCTFEVKESPNNFATTWKSKTGNQKTICELFSYVINSSRSGLKCYTSQKGDSVWNVIKINNTEYVYDISNKKSTSDSGNYKDAYKY